MTSLIALPIARHGSSSVRAATQATPLTGRHIVALDGIRGLAVLLVLVFHIFQVEPAPRQSLLRLGYYATRFGQTGVELFFVLSGFLITGILYDSKGSRRYFANFYGRRALRIFPLYYGLAIVMFLIVPRIVGFRVTDLSWFSLSTFSVNLAMAAGIDGGMISHYWSLAIEEQFYLVWPVFVYVLDRKALMRICLASLAASAALRMIVESRGISGFLLTPCRVDILLVGSFLALAARSPSGLAAWSRPALWVGVAALVVGFPLCLSMSGSGVAWFLALKYPIIAAFYGAILVAGVTNPPGTRVGRLLTLGPLRNLGKYGYGIYMYHPPLIPLGAWIVRKASAAAPIGGIPPAMQLIARIVLICIGSYGAAWLSWHLFEKRFLNLKRYFEYDRGTSATLPSSSS